MIIRSKRLDRVFVFSWGWPPIEIYSLAEWNACADGFAKMAAQIAEEGKL